jgi:hypothetical protein
MTRRLALFVTTAASLVAATVSHAAPPASTYIDPFVARPRIVVMTDIANEPDDQMSMVRFLLYSNQCDVEGLVATTSTWMKAKVRPDVILTCSTPTKGAAEPAEARQGYPTAASLRAVVAAGQPAYGMAAVGRASADGRRT